jgi:hypothetical protein
VTAKYSTDDADATRWESDTRHVLATWSAALMKNAATGSNRSFVKALPRLSVPTLLMPCSRSIQSDPLDGPV